MNEGVLVVQKNNDVKIHPQLNIPNLHVLMTMKSLKSRNYVEENYNWQHQYFVLTNEGIEYLRTFLHLSPTVFPATQSKKPPVRIGLKDNAMNGDNKGLSKYGYAKEIKI